MTNRVKTWKSLLCFAIFTIGLNHFSLGVPDAASAAPDAAAAAAALDLLNSGKLPEAEQAYSQFLTQYPTSGMMPEATFRLGYIQFLNGEYTLAVGTLNQIVSPPATPEIKAAADSLLPQVAAAEAAKIDPRDPTRKPAFDAAIKQFDAFIQKYPNSQQLESAIHGRAMAAYQAQEYGEAEKSLKENLQRFPNTESTLDNAYLLAVALTADASSIMAARGDHDAAIAKYNEALSYLASIIERQADVALANDAQYQIGEVLYNRGSAETGEKRTSDLSHAMDAYRAVQPQAAMMDAQQARVAATLAAVRKAALGNNAPALSEAQRQQDRENAKLVALKQAPDQTLSAQLRIGTIYCLLQKYDEARVLLGYVKGFADQPDQKKQIQYYLVLTYVSQGIMDKAAAGYSDFESTYRGDPLGENLPLLMGAAYLTGSNSQPEKAVTYLQQERQLYPNSPLVNDALNEQAAALVRQHQYAAAIDTYQRFLGTRPPPDQAAEAERGIAAIYQQTGKLPDAVRQYQKVADDFPGTPMAEQNTFYAAALETSVDMKQALPRLQAFVTKYPNGKFTAAAMMMIGQAQAAQGNTEASLQTYKDIIAKYPKTDSGPQAYFQAASILANEGKPDDMVALLREFIKEYPDNKDIFYAYDTIGQTQAGKGRMADAIATYTEMASQHADHPMAPTALYRTAELWRKMAASQGRFQGLNQEQGATWNSSMAGSVAAAESLVEKYPDSDQVGVALKTLVADQEMLLEAQQKKPGDIDKYFHDLAEKFASNPSAQSRILFTLATYNYKQDPAKAVAEMTVAYNPALVYAPADLDVYGSALLAQGKTDAAYKIYQKIAKDYPVPPNAGPAQAPPTIQEAQAMALFGMATALEKEGKTADAGKLFAQLKANYPWSPKVVEANFGIAKSLVEQKKLDDASKLLVGIVGSRTAPAPLRAHAFLLIGQIQEGKGNVDAAIDSYLKTAAYYGGVPDAASEGLWRGGQMLEKQAAGLTEQSTPKKSDQIGKAVSAYKDIGTKYPDSTFVAQAQDRLKALGQ